MELFMKQASFGVKSVIKQSWEVLKTQPKYLALLLLSIALVKFLGGSIGRFFGQQEWYAIQSVWGILTSVIDIYIGIITMVVSLKLIRGVKMNVNETWFTDKQAILQYVLVIIVYGFLVMVGYMLLIIPGIIIQVVYSLAVYLAIDRGMKMKAAMAESRRLTAGNRWKIFEIGIVLALLNVAGALFFGIGLIITIPLSMIAAGVIYTQLVTEDSKEPMKRMSPVMPEPVAATPASEPNQFQM
jgi:hypothetical protein